MIYYNFGLLEATDHIHRVNNTIKADQLDQFTFTVFSATSFLQGRWWS